MNMLRAHFLCEGGREFDGARCEMPTGEVVEVSKRRTPLFDLARKFEERGYGDWRVQIFTPQGTPSLKGLVTVMAELSVEESDKGGLRLRSYRPFELGRSAMHGDPGSEGLTVAGNGETALGGAMAPKEAA
jgi:hypothetical protein